MGLCLEGVPPPFSSRYAVQVRPDSTFPAGAALVWHLPNNYADSPHSPLGKVSIRELVVGCGRLFDQSEAPDGALDVLDELMRAHGERRDWFVLVTEHDTIVYFDPESQRLRHAPLGIVAPNLVFEWREGAGDLLLVDRASCRPLVSYIAGWRRSGRRSDARPSGSRVLQRRHRIAARL